MRGKILMSITLLSASLLTGCATDMLSTKENTPSTSHIKIYYSSEKPKHYKVVGRISAESYNLLGMAYSQSEIDAELKREAAKLGANGVMNINAGLAQTTAEAVKVS